MSDDKQRNNTTRALIAVMVGVIIAVALFAIFVFVLGGPR